MYKENIELYFSLRRRSLLYVQEKSSDTCTDFAYLGKRSEEACSIRSIDAISQVSGGDDEGAITHKISRSAVDFGL